MTILYTFIDEERHQEILDQHLNLFSEDFKSKILKYRRWEDAQLSLLGRILLLDGLKTYYDITTVPEIYILSNKKPYLKGNPVHFNISHSRNMVVCAIAGFPLGIDVEFLDHTINYFDFQFQMTTGEFEEIHHSEDKTKSFFRYWTRKEAVIKAHGDGMIFFLFFNERKDLYTFMITLLLSTMYSFVLGFGNGFINEYLNKTVLFLMRSREVLLCIYAS